MFTTHFHMDYKPYTYLIGWTAHNKWYYGSQYSQVRLPAHPDNLWKTYFTSSRWVKQMREQYGEPDVVQVRKVFKTADQAIAWERKVLKRCRVTTDVKWLNKIAAPGIRAVTGEKHWGYGSKRTAEQCENISRGCKETYKTKPHHRIGYKATDETREKCRQAKLGHQWSEGQRENYVAWRKKQKWSDEVKQKMSASQKARWAAKKAASSS